MDIRTPISKETLKLLKAGDAITITGVIYTARDAAHKMLNELIQQGRELPIDLFGAALYYTGPSPTKPGDVVGSIGPTTSYRMDRFTKLLLDQGLALTIGKGKRGSETISDHLKHGSVYCAAYGGAGAYLASKVLSISTAAFPELGPEAIFRLEVKDFPLTVINDVHGSDLYADEGAVND